MNEARSSAGSISRLSAASFLVDLAHFLVFGAIPFQAMQLGAGAFELGLVPALYAVTYVGASLAAGRFSDRTSRLTLLRGGIVLFLAASIAIAAVDRLSTLLALVAVMGLALGLFWSPIQAAVSDAAGAEGLPRALGKFNVAWSAGKGLGFLLAGVITHFTRAELAILAGVIPLLATLAILPRGGASVAPRPASLALAAPKRFVLLAWLANALAYGVSGTFNVHAPAFLEKRGEGALDFGVFLGIVFAVQTAAFVGTARRTPDFRTLAAAHACGLVALALFLTLPGAFGAIACALPLGLGLALAYQASLHASLHRDQDRGSAAGVHEAVLATGSSVVPLAGGAIAASSGSLAAPFHLCLGLLAVAFLSSLPGIVRRAQRSPADAKERESTREIGPRSKSEFGERGSSW